MFGKNESRHQIDARGNGTPHDDRHEISTGATGRVQHSILSADTKLTGDLVSSGDVTVEGTIDGSIKCRSLTLCGQPTIKGSVEAETAHVSGAFTGELRANKVILNKTAKMRGDIYQEILEIHTGAEFEGKVARLPASQSKFTAKSTAKSKAKSTAKSKAQATNDRDRSEQTEPDVMLLT
jgi:cytoskeletal protein CcmA (bactofilin family)